MAVFIANVIGLYLSGYYNAKDLGSPVTFVKVISHSNALGSLLWSSLAGCLVSAVLCIFQKIMSLKESMEAWTEGIKEVIEPCVILLFAWALGNIIQDLKTAPYIIKLVRDYINPSWLPFVSVCVCYLMSFATGTAFGTMAICFPILIPMAKDLSNSDSQIIIQCVGAILGGVTFGNNCSPSKNFCF